MEDEDQWDTLDHRDHRDHRTTRTPGTTRSYIWSQVNLQYYDKVKVLMLLSPILLLSWFKCGRPPVSSTGAFRLYLSQGVTAIVNCSCTGPKGGTGVNLVDCNAVCGMGVATWPPILTSVLNSARSTHAGRIQTISYLYSFYCGTPKDW